MQFDPGISLRSGYRRKRRRPGPSKGSAWFVVLTLVGLNYFLFFNGEDSLAPPTLEERFNIPHRITPASSQQKAEGHTDLPRPTGEPVDGRPAHFPQQNEPADDIVPSGLDDDNEFLEDDPFGERLGRKVAGSLGRGQSLLRALKHDGIDNRTALPVVHAMEAVFDFRQSQVGDKFSAWLDDDGRIRRFRYVQSLLDVYEVNRGITGEFEARKVTVPTRVELARIGCAIHGSLYSSISRCGESMQLGNLLIDLFVWDIDFFLDVRRGDEFRVVVEKVYVEDRFLKYGRVLAADYRGKFGQHRMVYYTAQDGSAGYYTAAGRGIRKEFLKSPLQYTRVSSRGNSYIRTGLKKASPVVYTASAGTPTWAVASGSVIFSGESGSLGKTVTIQHDNGYTSTYGYLQEIATSIEVGTDVDQKTVLGVVGTTELSAEPKLLFSVRRNGKLINPLNLRFSEGSPIADEFKEHFDEEVKNLLRDLDAMTVLGIHETHG